MKQKSRSYAGLFQGVVILGTLLFFISPVFSGVASIYKWKDEQGKVHFTDDPLKIPLRYRSDPDLEKIRALPSKNIRRKASANSKDQKAQGKVTDASDAKQNEGDENKANDKKTELAAMRDALGFLKNDVQRYKKYDDYVPQHRHAIVLRAEIVNVIPAKEALAKKLETSDSTLLKQVSSYLKTSLQKDYAAKKREHPRRRIFISERTRLNGEQAVKNSLIKQLNASLDKAPGNTSQKQEPQKTQAPAKAPDQDASKTTRKYGSY